jgi:hypothetical protein
MCKFLFFIHKNQSIDIIQVKICINSFNYGNFYRLENNKSLITIWLNILWDELINEILDLIACI